MAAAQLGLGLWQANPALVLQVAAVLAAAAGFWLRLQLPLGEAEEDAALHALLVM